MFREILLYSDRYKDDFGLAKKDDGIDDNKDFCHNSFGIFDAEIVIDNSL